MHSERAFCEELEYNLPCRWFLDMDLIERSFDATVFTKNRQRLLAHDAGRTLFDEVVWAAAPPSAGFLYMATVTAIRYNPAIRDFYTHLYDKGKPGKVALVAAIRKLLTFSNAVSRDQVPWQTEPMSTAIHT